MIEEQNSQHAEPSELEHLYRVAPVGLCLTDTDHRYVRINQKLADINGKTVAEHLGRTVRGREVWLHDIVKVVSSNREPHTLRGFMIDVTKARRVEDELRQKRAELAHIGRLDTMGHLAAAITHELNQPLAAIAANVGAARRFLDSGEPENTCAILEDIAADNRRAAESSADCVVS